MHKTIATLLLIGFTTVAHAANISISGGSDGITDITITGELVDGDDAKFDRLAAGIAPTKAVIVLEGPGGNLGAGLSIGATIAQKKFGTAVTAGKTCASSCGLIWLAGKPRMLTNSSYIGFHAARDGRDVSGRGNAVVGAYLTSLGITSI